MGDARLPPAIGLPKRRGQAEPILIRRRRKLHAISNVTASAGYLFLVGSTIKLRGPPLAILLVGIPSILSHQTRILRNWKKQAHGANSSTSQSRNRLCFSFAPSEILLLSLPPPAYAKPLHLPRSELPLYSLCPVLPVVAYALQGRLRTVDCDKLSKVSRLRWKASPL